MDKPTIAMFNLNETGRDPRVRRIASSLAAKGCRVIVFEINYHSQKPRETCGNFTIVRVNMPESRQKKDMEALEKAAPDAAGIIRECEPEIMDTHLPFSRTLVQKLKRRFHTRILSKLPGVRKREDRPGTSRDLEILDIRSIMLRNLALYKAAEKYSPEIAHCNDLDTLLCGFMFKKNKGLPLIYDAHEIYPEQLAEHMRSYMWHHFYTELERKLIREADGRMTVCDSIATYFYNTYGVPGFITLRSLPSIKLLAPPLVPGRINKPARILYHGAYYQYRGLDEVISAARWLEGGRIILRGVGPYEKTLKELVSKENVHDKVTIVKPVTINELISSASECDIGLNPFINVCKNTEYVLPNKFFEYMMAGLALASADLIEMRKLTEKLNIGILFNPNQPEEIAENLNSLIRDRERLEHYRRNAYEAARTEYHWEMEEHKLFHLYDRFL